MAEVSKEEQMKLAIKAFNQGQFQSKTSCAQAFMCHLHLRPWWNTLKESPHSPAKNLLQMAKNYQILKQQHYQDGS